MLRKILNLSLVLFFIFHPTGNASTDRSPQSKADGAKKKKNPIVSKDPPTEVGADVLKEVSFVSQFKLLNFRVSELSILQGSNTSFSGGVTWNPMFNFLPRWTLVGNFGIFPLLGVNKSLFLAFEYMFYLSYSVDKHFAVDLGFGAQTWLSAPSLTTLIFGSNLSYGFSDKILYCIDRVFLGYSIDTSSTLSHEFKVGFQIAL